MAYATVADVKRKIPGTDFPSTANANKVDETDLEAWIDEAEQEIDDKLRHRYEVPITGTAALITLRQFVVDMVVWRVKAATEKRSVVPVPGSGQGFQVQEPNAADPVRVVRARLKAIAEFREGLGGATEVNTSTGIRDYVTENDVEPEFDATKEQW